jgi:putative endonuclease
MRSEGARWEAAAQAYLESAGLTLLARNYTTRLGELDLVMRDGSSIVFVEVRYRENPAHGDGADSIGSAKRRKLVRAAALYLQEHPKFAALPCRFDVVALSGTQAQTTLDWQRSAFDAFS